MDKEKNKIQLSNFETKEDTQSLYKVVKDNPKDKIEVEIGDSKDSSEMFPQAKIQRWNNEINFSIRYKEDNSKDEKTVEVKDSKFVWKKGKQEVHIYEKPEVGEDGGLELEVLLGEKPKSNVIKFSIQTKGLNFFYQPKDTKDQNVTINSEIVKGSYAVYHKEKSGNFADKEYKTGKAFHIYRPKVTDADGNEIWGELNIDEDSGLLTITVDDKWLSKAVYPVLIDPTFGHTSETTWGTYNTDGNEARSALFSCSSDGTVSKITAYVKESNGFNTANVKAFITNSDYTSIITNGVTNSTTVTSSSLRWEDFDYSSQPSVSGSTNYGLSIVPDATIGLGCDSPGGTLITDDTNSYSSPQATSGGSSTSYLAGIYATYTASASGPAGVKTINGTAIASVKTINDTAIANVKTINS